VPANGIIYPIVQKVPYRISKFPNSGWLGTGFTCIKPIWRKPVNNVACKSTASCIRSPLGVS
jgi:hypothetical protein